MGGADKVEVCRKLGAELAIDYRNDDFVEIVKEATGGNGADVIYDPVGGDVYDRSTKCIAFEGRILVIGFTSGRFPDTGPGPTGISISQLAVVAPPLTVEAPVTTRFLVTGPTTANTGARKREAAEP